VRAAVRGYGVFNESQAPGLYRPAIVNRPNVMSGGCTMTTTNDLYPTRLNEKCEMFQRRDPVIYSRGRRRSDGPLSEADIAAYERDGFLHFPAFFSERQMRPFLDDLDEYGRDNELKGRDQVIIEPFADEIRSIFAIHQISGRFDRLTREPRVLDIAHQLLDSDVYIHRSRINYKPGFTGTGFNWHSDFETWHSEDGMPRMRCFSMSILLTENNEFNGPLMLIPGSHKWFIPTVGKTPQENWKESLKMQTLGVPEPADLHKLTGNGGLVAPKGPAGSLLLFECNTLHASSNNLSPWPRSNLFFVFNSVENKLQPPFCGNRPRPEFVASRQYATRLEADRKAA
jgi:ectoine hydroxylase